MAEVSYRRFTPNDVAALGFSGSVSSDGIAIALAPLTGYEATSHTVTSITVALTHRKNQAGGHGTPTVISCYIAKDVTLGTAPFPSALTTAENTIASTDVSSYTYGVYDGTFSLHTFTFDGLTQLSVQNWVILSQSAGDTSYQSFTALAGWKLSHGAFVGTANGVLAGLTYYRAISGGVGDWQTAGLATQWQYLDVDGTFIGSPESIDDLTPFPPDRPVAYDPDLPWIPGEWSDPNTYVPPDWGTDTDYVAAGGGRWGQNLVVAGNQKIYYEPHAGV